MNDGAPPTTDEIITNIGIGHNQPVSDHQAAIEQQAEFLASFAQRRDDFVRAAERAVIRDRATVGDAGDVIHLANRIWDKINDGTRDFRMPFRDTADGLKRRVDEFWAPVMKAHQALQAKIDAWMEAEDQRIAAQRDEQEAALGLGSPVPADPPAATPAAGDDAPAAAPAATPARPTGPAPAPRAQPIRGDLGSRVSRRADVQIEVTDVHLVPDFILQSPAVTEAIIAVVRAMAKGGAAIPGIRVTPIKKTSVS